MDNIRAQITTAKNLLILGFGREGQSTYIFIRAFDPVRVLTIADASEQVRTNELLKNDPNVRFITGRAYLEEIAKFDCIIKTPGISLSDEMLTATRGRLTSQADLFLRAYRDQTIGVTGTKGKSTTSSFIHHALRVSGVESVLLGNIGVPPFDALSSISKSTQIVFELSSHMLQTVSVSPHIAIVLNIFPEHLDYYETMERYVESKSRIFMYQSEADVLITDMNEALEAAIARYGTKARRVTWGTAPSESMPFAPRDLGDEQLVFLNKAESVPFYNPSVATSINGQHVRRSLLLASVAACYAGADPYACAAALTTFQGLPHRLENVGMWKGITFINDSISTIPESTLAGLVAFPQTNVLILGGMNRGVSYAALVHEIAKHSDLFVLCIDETGERLYAGLMEYTDKAGQYFLLDGLEQAVQKSYELLPDGGTVLFSPGAASYTKFKNFEERGQAFAEYAMKYGV